MLKKFIRQAGKDRFFKQQPRAQGRGSDAPPWRMLLRLCVIALAAMLLFAMIRIPSFTSVNLFLLPCLLALLLWRIQQLQSRLTRMTEQPDEQQLAVQSQQLEALLETSPLAMAYIVNRKLKRVNEAFLALFDCTEASSINLTTRQFYQSDEQYEQTGRTLYVLLNEGKVVTIDLQLQTGTGNPRWVRLHGKALDPAIPGLGNIWVYQDISVERATAQALRNAKELAEGTSRTKTEFLANMSHELRTPMHAILGFAEIGMKKADKNPGKVQQYFDRILLSGNRLLSLLNDLLDLAKMEVGKMEYHLEKKNLAVLLHEVNDELAALIEQKQITIMLDCQSSSLMAQFDPVRITQVMRNLLTNAIKFSPINGKIMITAGISHVESSGPLVKVNIRDQGPGIPDDELESIFGKFIQSSSTKTGAGGSGLGLAICSEIIHAHHGSIQACNLPEGGTCFSFSFPVNPDQPTTGTPDNAT